GAPVLTCSESVGVPAIAQRRQPRSRCVAWHPLRLLAVVARRQGVRALTRTPGWSTASLAVGHDGRPCIGRRHQPAPAVARRCPVGDHAPARLCCDTTCQVCQVGQDDPRWQWAHFGAAAAGWVCGLAVARLAFVFRKFAAGDMVPMAVRGGFGWLLFSAGCRARGRSWPVWGWRRCCARHFRSGTVLLCYRPAVRERAGPAPAAWLVPQPTLC